MPLLIFMCYVMKLYIDFMKMIKYMYIVGQHLNKS